MYPTYDALSKDLGYQQIDAATLVAASSLTIPPGTKYILLQAEVAPVRWRGKRVNPTGSVGMIIPQNMSVWYTVNQLSDARFIAGGAGAILNVNYYA